MMSNALPCQPPMPKRREERVNDAPRRPSDPGAAWTTAAGGKPGSVAVSNEGSGGGEIGEGDAGAGPAATGRAAVEEPLAPAPSTAERNRS